MIFVTFLSLLANKPAAWGNTPPAGKQAVVTVKGLSCPVCARRLQKVLATLPRAKNAKVQLEKEQAVINFAGDTKVTDTQLQETVRNAGFVPGKIEWRAIAADERKDPPMMAS